MNGAGNDTKHWQSWARQAQKGDKAAYRDLLTEISVYIRNYLSGSLANPDWVDDVCQEVLVSVHKSLKTYAPNRPFKPWLVSIIHFRRADFLRKHYGAKKDVTSSLEDVQDIGKNLVTDSDVLIEYKDVEKFLATLPEKQRRVFEMIKIEGYAVKEVAQEMDMSVSAVKVSAHRTMHKLKEKLGS